MRSADTSLDARDLSSAEACALASTALPVQRASGYHPLVAVLAAVCAGIVLDRQVGLSFGLWWAFGVLAWLLWHVLWRSGRNRGAELLLLAAFAAIGGAWHHASWHLFSSVELGLAAGREAGPVCFEGLAASSPRRMPAPEFDPLNSIPTGERCRLELQITGVRDADHWRPAEGKTTLVVEGHLLDVRAGDLVRVFGQLARLSAPNNPGEFDYAAFARTERRLCRVYADFPECVTTQSRDGASPAALIDGVRRHGAQALSRHLGPSTAGLAAAMFLGVREELQPEASQAFLETGTIHLLVISGVNVAILAGLLFLGLRAGLMGQSVAFAAAAVLTILYAAITDAQPPVVRATVMVLAVCAARIVGRGKNSTNILAAAALVVLAVSPGELFGAGTQLSFLGAAGLMWSFRAGVGQPSSDPLDRLIAAARPVAIRAARKALRGVWMANLSGLVIWLLVAPLVMSRFHLVSPVAILLGPILAIPVTAAMMFGFAVMLLGWLVPPLGSAGGWFCGYCLTFFEGAVEASRHLPGSHFWVPGPADWWLLGFYGGIALWAIAGRVRPPRRWCVAGFAGWCAIGLSASWLGGREADKLECTFLSVGHGLAVVLQLPDGRTMLYDAGRIGPPVVPARSVAGYLWSRGITRLDAVVISHADVDHYNALPALLKQFSIGTIYVSPTMFERSTGAVEVLRQAILRSGVPLREVWAGDRLRAGDDCRIEVLHPPRAGVFGTDNANSIVLSIAYQGRRVLLTGDLESPGLDDVLAEEPYPCDVLLAPHHGSTHSDPPGIADWSWPEYVIISGGPRDRHDEVTSAYARRGSRVLHTAEEGAVHVGIAGGELEVDAWRDRRSF